MTPSAVCGLVLLWLCSLGEAVDVKVLSTKPVGNNGDTFKLKGRCILKMTADRVEAQGGQLTIQFDKDTMKFKSGKVIVLTSNSTTYLVTNKKLIKTSKFKLVFTVLYTGTDVPSGTCSELQTMTTSTSTSTSTTAMTSNPTTTTVPPGSSPNSQQMTLISSWPVAEGTRFEGMFRFEVLSDAEPFTESFNVSFGETVTSFKYWRWEQRNPAPAITSGSWFLMTNLHLLQCSIEEYYFQATVAGNQIPDVTCYSSLKAKNPPTTGQPTQPPLTTQKPGTTQPPATTQPPVTTEPVPFSQKMTLVSSWSVEEGTRFEGLFRFEVLSDAEPFTESFNVSFGETVTSFKYWRWEQKNPDPAITSGSWFLMTNLYLLQCSIEEYYFQATVAGNLIPDVTCYSSLKARDPPTTGQPTQPTLTTQPPRTTQAPATTQQPPATAEPVPFSQKMTLISSWSAAEGTRFEGMFRFEVLTDAEPFTESFNVSFGETVTSFKYWRWEQRNPDPAITSVSWFLMTNRYLLECSIEEYYFQATVAGNQVPDVTCYSSLKAKNPPTTGKPTQPPQTTQPPRTTQAPATTQQPPATTEPVPFSQKMTLISSWPVAEGTWFEGMFRFEVLSDAEPFTESFNVSFGETVTSFMYWRWEQRNPDPAITSGSWFLMTNLYLLQCSIEEYYFKATVAGNQIPDVTCYSSLKAKNPPTTGQPTQPPQTTQPPRTTQSPATTQQPPATTEPAPNSQQMTLISSWPVTEGTRFEGMFRFEVMGTAEPFMETFNVSFGKTVTSFKYWRWEQRNPDPAITSGSWFLMTNLYLLQCSIEEYYFQATVAGNQIPDVTCYSSLKAKNPPTTGQPTQPPQTTQKPGTTQAPSQPPQTTSQQPPVTVEPDTCDNVEVEEVDDWLVSGDVRRMKGQCVFSLSKDVPVNGLTVDITWDKPTLELEDYNMTRIDSDDVNGLWKYSTNTYPLSENTFKYEFEVSYVGPTHPEGRCYSDLGGDGGSSLGTTPSVTAQPTTVAMK